MPEIRIGPSRIIFNYRSITPEAYTLVPRLRLDFDIHYALEPGRPSYNMALKLEKSELKIITKRGENLYAGPITPGQVLITLTPNSSAPSNLFIDLDYYKLA